MPISNLAAIQPGLFEVRLCQCAWFVYGESQIRMLEHEFIPARETNSRRLWIMLHGLGDSIEGYRWLPQAMQLPWMNYLLVNAPE